VSLAAAAAVAALPHLGHPPTPSPGKGGMDGHPMYPCAKLKLDQLFLQWLSLPESQTLVSIESATVVCPGRTHIPWLFASKNACSWVCWHFSWCWEAVS
jgi:hypothetical protein